MSITSHKINEAYYKRFTKESSKFYINKMHLLLKEGQTEKDLQNTANGVLCKHHLMYKIDVLYSKDGHRGYDFLIEYHVEQPDVGIYFGCRGFTLDGYNHEEEIQLFIKEWESIKGAVCTILNNTFPNKDFSNRFKMTNNANNGTFWPFWITLYEDEDIHEIGVRATTLIRNVYKKMLEGYVVKKRVVLPKNSPEEKTAFTQRTFEDLQNTLIKGTASDCYFNLNKEKKIKLFKEIIKGVEYNRFFSEDKDYEKAYRVQGSNVYFICFLKALFGFFYGEFESGNSKTFIKWDKVLKVFLDKNGNAYQNSLKTQASDAIELHESDFLYWKNFILEIAKTIR